MEDCIVYLVWQLRQSGFEVRFTWPNVLFISWRHHEGAYLATQNPIMKAMTPAPPPPPTVKTVGGSQKKKSGVAAAPAAAQPRQPTVAFNEAVDLITSANPSTFGTPVPPGTRRATDYEPPASFIQNLERPGPGRDKAVAKGNVLADLWTI